MKSALSPFLWFGLLVVASAASQAHADEGASLQQTIEAFEQADAELAQATKELKAAARPLSERRRLEAQIRQLQARQEELLARLERWVGPLPPIVRSEPRVPSEEQLRTLERRQDTVLESK